MMNFLKFSFCLGLLFLLTQQDLYAQEDVLNKGSPSIETHPEHQTHDVITITGHRLKKSKLDELPVAQSLSGEKLDKKVEASLGETLGKELGVSSTFYGPNASRPVVRGLEGERLRILENGTSVVDASGASQDHALVVDPLSLERVDVLRGPAALLYGTSSIGGIVNTVTGRIPTSLHERVRAEFDTRFSSVDRGRAFSLDIDKSFGSFAFHIDGSLRRSDDYTIPSWSRVSSIRNQIVLEEHDEEEHEPDDDHHDHGGVFSDRHGKVLNSASETWNAALGASYIGENGHLGIGLSRYQSNYGVIAFQDVEIELDQMRLAIEGESRNLGPLQSIRFKSTQSRYRHQEMEEAEVGTRFKNDGHETRIEIKPPDLGMISTIVGIQSQTSFFRAQGSEAFVPPTHNSQLSAFLFEEAKLDPLTQSLGLRLENALIKTKNSGDFGPSESKSFQFGSVSLGFRYDLTKQQSLNVNTSYTERAPHGQELFADGPHIATGIYEQGNKELKKENSRGLEFFYQNQLPFTRAKVGGFVQDFSNYIALSPTDEMDAVERLPIYAYHAVPARLHGFEASLTSELWHSERYGLFELDLKYDSVFGKNRDSDEHLPRITPERTSFGLRNQNDYFDLQMEAQHVLRQKRLAPHETSTPPYTLFNASLDFPLEFANGGLDLFIRGQNLNNAEARQHASLLKDLAPLPGRNISVGARGHF